MTQLSLPYNNTVCTSALYTIYRFCAITPAFTSTIDTIPHLLCTFLQLCYRAALLPLLYAMVRPKYGIAAADSRGSKLTFMDN